MAPSPQFYNEKIITASTGFNTVATVLPFILFIFPPVYYFLPEFWLTLNFTPVPSYRIFGNLSFKILFRCLLIHPLWNITYFLWVLSTIHNISYFLISTFHVISLSLFKDTANIYTICLIYWIDYFFGFGLINNFLNKEFLLRLGKVPDHWCLCYQFDII
jgi:hypothetical protein